MYTRNLFFPLKHLKKYLLGIKSRYFHFFNPQWNFTIKTLKVCVGLLFTVSLPASLLQCGAPGNFDKINNFQKISTGEYFNLKGALHLGRVWIFFKGIVHLLPCYENNATDWKWCNIHLFCIYCYYRCYYYSENNQLYNNCKIGHCPSLFWHSFHLISCLGQWHLPMREEQ